MKKTLIGAAAFALGLAGIAAFAAPAQAAGPVQVASACNTGWYVNEDEAERLPEQVEGGLEFEGDDLVHHAISTTVEDLTPGTFEASVEPDQDSFFSVEVYGDDGGYATLRWNTATSEWNMVTGGQLYSDADPAVLVDMVTPHKSHKVVSFGVGYTANPPGTVTTVVSSVIFAGKTYSLDCPAKPANKDVVDERWECTTGYSTRGGTVEYTWDETKREWVETDPVWGDWEKQRDLSAEESANLECQTDEPTNPGTDPTPPTGTSSPGPTPSETESTQTQEAGLPVTGQGGGTNVPLIGALAGTALLALGAALFVWARRRREDEAEFTA